MYITGRKKTRKKKNIPKYDPVIGALRGIGVDYDYDYDYEHEHELKMD